jgi:putative heme-binding domain-containing protein
MTDRTIACLHKFVWIAVLGLLPVIGLANDGLRLEKGDHICIIGNTLADRMQHDGWLEASLQARFPEHELVIRNLGFSADTLTVRLRSQDFGSPQHHLAKNKADVVFMMFGYNESFAGQAGLDDFRKQLDAEIKLHLAAQYNGKSAPRVVVFSPIAHEDLHSPDLPDGKANNIRLDMYTAAMREVATQNGVSFVDLFNPTLAAFAAGQGPYTINGIHLNSRGNELVAKLSCDALFGPQPLDASRLEEIRTAVKQKNFCWYNLYRTVDGYSIYGGRADLKFTNGQTNRVVMQREMDILQQMTDNRDPAIWAAAQGKPSTVDDSNTPDFIPVISNKPGTGPNGEYIFLSGEEAAKRMKLLDGFQVNLFASEEQFPELINPVQMAFDPRGRLFVAAWQSYPHWKPKNEMNDKLLILKDNDGDGHADECQTFADGLHNPTGFEFWGGGVFVAMAPEILFLQDTDGDDVADKRTVVLHGLDTADTHHTANSFTLGPDGGLYFQEGTFHHTQVESPYGPPVRNANGAVYRYDPRTQYFMVYTPKSYANPHGHVFGRWGQDIVHDGTGADPYDGTLISSHLEFPDKHGNAPMVYERRTRPLPASEILSSRHFPDEMQDELLVENVIGDLGILRYKISEDGSSMHGEELEPLLLSDDQNFRPVDLEFGPRGELFFTDWANPIIGHMQHNLRDPNRDHTHGRVFRITHVSRPLGEPEEIAGLPLPRLLNGLKSTDNRLRYRTRIELSGRNSKEVIAATDQWVRGLNRQDPDYQRQLLEALWVHQQHNTVNEMLLETVLNSPDSRARSAATKVLCYWRDKVPDSASRMLKMAVDENPRVRLEALRAASFFPTRDGLPIMIAVLQQPTDKYLEWLAQEVVRAFPDWQELLVKENLLPGTNSHASNFFLNRLSTTEVQRLPMDRVVGQHLLLRPGIGETTRGVAVKTLAELDNKSEVQQLVETVLQINPETTDATVVNELVRLLAAQSPTQLALVREQLMEMAASAQLPILRQIGYIGALTADQNVESVWKKASQSSAATQDLLAAMPLIPDPNLQSQLYPYAARILADKQNNTNSGTSNSVRGRFVRIEIPGNARTLTLAEVQVFSNNENVAMSGTATQSDTAHGGTATRGIDGNTSGEWEDGGQTHTPEDGSNPWWEVDLGGTKDIEEIVIFNRTGSLANRLAGFTLKILDDNRQTVFIRKDQPAPEKNAEFEIGATSPIVKVRRTAMDAVSCVRGKEAEAFGTLSGFIVDDVDQNTAIRAIQRIPKRFWPAERAPQLVEIVMAKLREIPASARNSSEATDAMQLADSLSTLLEDQASAEKIRSELADLGVRTIKIGTRPHRMAYDKELIVVKAGKPVEIVFENSDMMPHNLVVTKPGTMSSIGMQAEAEATRPEAIKNDYVPKSSNILLSSHLMQPGQSQHLTFEVPSEPGVYPYVCTYPGHWRRMFGILMVVNDPAAYTADPDKYMAANNLEIKDELLKLVLRTKTEWQFVDFENSFAGTDSEFLTSRNFDTGKQMFQLSSCISCHKINGEGYEIGPDLTKDLDPKWTAQDILREILDPSRKIDEKYQSRIIALETGETVSGIVTFEDDNVIKLVENPLVANEPRIIEKFAIEDERKSDVSVMPKGLLDTLTRREILDLVAYIVAKGDSEYDLFKDGDHALHGQ